jgi:hypothetical protein
MTKYHLQLSIAMLQVGGSALLFGCQDGPTKPQPSALANAASSGSDRSSAGPADSDGQASQLLRAHLALINGSAMSAEQHADSLAALRKNPGPTVEALARAYHAQPKANYYQRWAMVETLGNLAVEEGYPILAEVADAPLPPREGDPEHSATDQEMMIRFRAIEGLGRLSGRGHAGATAVLKQTMKSSERGLRREAAQAFVSARATPERVAEAKSILDPEDHWMTDVGPSDRTPVLAPAVTARNGRKLRPTQTLPPLQPATGK